MSQNIVAISADFLTAFSVLPRQTQGKVTEFINKFRNNPNSPGINYEKIHDATDKKMYSVRIDDTYRGIVVRQEASGVYLLLWVDHHDDAYDWARRKKCEINHKTGNVQVFDVQNDLTQITEEKSLYEGISDEQLFSLGVPVEQLALIRSISKIEDLYSAKKSIPPDAYEGLEWIANGFKFEEVMQLFASENTPEVNEDDFASALQNVRSMSAFVIVDGEEELRKIMAEPLEKWRIFLHPSQRKLVNKEFSGPARVLGGAGTGKTVVAMHRAKWLAGKLKGKEKILFTTYTANLADDIKDSLRKICTVEELKHIEVINLDA